VTRLVRGSDIAKETSGIILIKDDIMDVARAIKLSRATMRKIRLGTDL
jgi:Cu+-exporting ATPase